MTTYESMWNVLQQYQFPIDHKLSSYVTCTICHKLLIDACFGPCGCNYCKRCVEIYLENEEKYCPGNGIDCKVEQLSRDRNIAQDICANKKVSKLLMKCPSTSCSSYIELIHMADHLKMCDRPGNWCPYSEIGCTVVDNQMAEISNHLRTESEFHDKLLISSIVNLKNEVVTFLTNQSEDVIDNKLNRFEKSIDWKISRIMIEVDAKSRANRDSVRKLQEEMTCMSETNENLIKTIEEIKINNNMLQERLTKLEESNVDLETKICRLNETLAKELNQRNTPHSNQHFQEFKPPMVSLSNSFVMINESYFGNTITNKPNFPIAFLTWDLSDIDDIRTKNGHFSSDYFSTINKEYEMRLRLFPGGFNGGSEPHITVKFYIATGSGKFVTQWPFKGRVTIAIVNKSSDSSRQVLSKQCDIAKPRSAYYSRELFHFQYVDLDSSGVLVNNSISIECEVVIKK